MQSTINDIGFYEDLIKQSKEERIEYFKNHCSVTDLEQMACSLYFNIDDISAKDNYKTLLNDILKQRANKLDSRFSWTEKYEKQLFEIDNSVKQSITIGHDEAERLFKKRKPGKNINTDEIQIIINPYIHKTESGNSVSANNDQNIYSVLFNGILSKVWMFTIINNDDYLTTYSDELQINRILTCWSRKPVRTNKMRDFFFGHDDKLYTTLYYLKYDNRILSWYDILQINRIRINIGGIKEQYIEDIGKGIFWEDGIQSLIEKT